MAPIGSDRKTWGTEKYCHLVNLRVKMRWHPRLAPNPDKYTPPSLWSSSQDENDGLVDKYGTQLLLHPITFRVQTNGVVRGSSMGSPSPECTFSYHLVDPLEGKHLLGSNTPRWIQVSVIAHHFRRGHLG